MARPFFQSPLTLFQIMKNAGFLSFFPLFCLLFSIGFSGVLFGNDNSQPLSGIGSTLQIAEETFDWQYAEDDGTYRFDIYVSSGYSVYVTSVLDAGEFALASGTSASGGVSGLVMFGAGSEAYKPYSGTRSLTGPTSYYGWNYDSGQLTWQYYADLSSGSLSYTYTESWTSPTGSILLWGDLNGVNSWSMAHADSGTQYSPSSGQNSLQLFGGDYLFTYGTYYWSVSASGDNVGPTWSNEYNSWQDYYSNGEGGSAQVYWNNFIPDTTLVGWDPYVGDFYGYNSFAPLDLTTILWNGRGGSTFTAGSGQVWVKQDSEINYRLMNFAWGEVKSSGQVTDSFVHGENELSLMIDGNVKAFQTGQAPADVRMDGVLIGTVSLNGFDVTASGWDIRTSDPGTIVDEPFFLSTTTLWVNGTPFVFDHGHLSSTGDRTDIYNHESLGSVTLSGIDIDQFNASVLVTGSSSGSGAFSRCF